jgi:hypothetical protein
MYFSSKEMVKNGIRMAPNIFNQAEFIFFTYSLLYFYYSHWNSIRIKYMEKKL